MKAESDSEVALVLAWIAAQREAGRGKPDLEELLMEAYVEREYHKHSNGCNLVNELHWPFPRHPACVVHDMLYNDQRGWGYSDKKMRQLNAYFGRPKRGWVRWAGLRLGGWYAYYYGDKAPA